MDIVKFRTAHEANLSEQVGLDKLDWFFAGEFIPSRRRDRLNQQALTDLLTQHAGPDSHMLVRRAGDLFVVNSLVFKPKDDLAFIVWDALVTIQHEGILCDETYWEEVTPLLQQRWHDMPLSDRAGYLDQVDLGPELMLQAEVPSEVHTLFYRDLDDA